MKRIIFIISMLLIVSFICSCGQTNNNNTDSTATTSVSTAKTDSSVPAKTETVETLAGVLNEDVNVVFISSGRSDSILLMTDGKAYMIDTGEKAKELYKLTERILKIYNITKISGVFLTHTHKDHIGGLKRLSENFKIECVYSAGLHTTSDKIEETVKELGLTHKLLNAGDKFVINDKVFFDILAPIALDYSEENNNSLVMMLNANGKKVLFTGDMEFAQETTLLEKDGIDLKADVLKIANHGNPDASSTRFLNAVSPLYAVVCTDRAEDPDSANEMIKQALPDTNFYITDEYTLGVFVKISGSGDISVETK